jgi:hypothetical protein
MQQRSVSDVVTSWTKDLASPYDYFIVLPAKKGELENRSIGYIKTLRKLSFDMFIYKNLNADDEVFLLINAPLDKLKACADISNFALPLNSYVVAEKLYQKGIEINHMPEVVRYTPYEQIYGRFRLVRNRTEIETDIFKDVIDKVPDGWSLSFDHLVDLPRYSLLE